ncbi:MAG: efflux RND transporter periplasmic adaptor subunit [Desulfuromonadaceae bacterium]|nr:efflux RND transporter periplasmic adaptor subunit [Desulfuromonadaceae bacterium]
MRNYVMTVSILLTAAMAVGGCSKKHEADNKAALPAVVVKGTSSETVKSSAVPETLEVVGTVRAGTSAVVSARIPGSVSILMVREGDRVRKGQLLGQLEAVENLANAAVATAGIDDARQGVDEAKSRKKLADSTFDRYNMLFNEKAISRQEFDVKQSEKELASQGLSRAESRLKQAQERSRAASTISDYTRITAPISGIITSKPVDLGATVFPAQPLMTIEDEGSYFLELAVPESLSTRVKPGSTVLVMLDALGAPFETRIAEIVPSVDPSNRSFIAKITLPQKALKSGMFGRGAINLGTTVNGITLPKKAVVEHGAMTSVWVLDKDKSARMRIIKIGKALGDRQEILSGLSEGEIVVVSGVEKVIEGSKVE